MAPFFPLVEQLQFLVVHWLDTFVYKSIFVSLVLKKLLDRLQVF